MMNTNEQYIEDLVQAYHAGDLNPMQQEELLHLIQTDAAAAEVFRQYAVMRQSLPAENGGHETAYRQFLESTRTKAPIRSVHMWPLSYWAAAASIILLAGIFLWMRPQPIDNITVASIGIHSLPDSTLVTIGQGTELSYPAQFGNERKIALTQGQAFFEVKRDSLHPFIVQLPNGAVEVLGTSFNLKIDSLSGNTMLTVVSGRVLATALSGNDRKILTKGQAISFNSDGTIARETTSANGNELSWKTGKLVFASTPMPEVVRAINNHFGSTVRIEGNTLDSCKLNANFTEPELPKILDMLKIAFDVEFTEKDGAIILRGPGC